MTKKDLILEISKDTGMNVKDSQTVLASMLSNIIKVVQSSEGIVLPGFGSFRKVELKARICRNPQTGQEIKVEARNTIKFRPSTKLKEKLN